MHRTQRFVRSLARVSVLICLALISVLPVQAGELTGELAALAEQYLSGDQGACREASNALSGFDGDAGPLAPILVAILKDDGGSGCAENALSGLLNIGPGIGEYVDAGVLLPLLLERITVVSGPERTEDAMAAESAILLLGYFGTDAGEAVPLLTRILSTKDTPIERRYVAMTLGSIGEGSPVAVEALVNIVQDTSIDQYGEMDLRKSAAMSLGQIPSGSATSAPVLAAALEDSESGVSWGAKEALAALGGAAVPAMAARLKDADDDLLSTLLRIFEGLGPEAAAAGPELVKALERHESYLFYEFSSVLAAIGPGEPETVELLGGAAGHQNEEVAQVAIQALGSYGPAAKPALTALRKAAESDNWSVKSEAEEAIKLISE